MATMKERIMELSEAIRSKITNKVDKEGTKTLTTNDFTDALKSKLDGLVDANVDQALRDLSYYKINTVPYLVPVDLQQIQSNAYALIEKKRIDYLVSKQSLKHYSGDRIKLQYLNIKMSRANLTSEEKELFNKLMYRLDFEINVDNESNAFDDSITTATTEADIDTIVTNAVFSTVWDSKLD